MIEIAYLKRIIEDEFAGNLAAVGVMLVKRPKSYGKTEMVEEKSEHAKQI